MIEPEVDEPGGMGHNQPPSPIDVLVGEQRDAQDQHTARRDEVIDKLNGKVVEDRVSAGEAGDLISIANAILETLSTQRVERTKPYRDAADKAKEAFDNWAEPLSEAVEALKDRLDAWADEEKTRREEQQAEQANLLGDVNSGPKSTSPIGHRPSKAKEQVVAKGDYGSKVVKKEVKRFRVTDVRAVPDFILNSSTVHDAIISVAKSMAKHNPDIPGIETTTEEETRIR